MATVQDIMAETLAETLRIEAAVNQVIDLGDVPGRFQPGRKLLTVVHAILAGGDCIDDADMLRSGCTDAVLGHEVRATYRAKPTQLIRRGRKRAKPVLAHLTAEVLPHYASRARESARMSFAARPAVAMHYWHIDLVHFVAHSPAQAASLQRHSACHPLASIGLLM